MMQHAPGMQPMQPGMNMMAGMGNPMTPVRGGPQPQQQQQQQQVIQPDPSQHYLRASSCLPLNQPLTYELAVSYLLKSLSIAQTTPFYWLPIDKPAENDLYLVYHTGAPTVPWAADGIRYLDGSESSFRASIGGHDLEVKETKYGFVPGQEAQASRVKRKFRLLKGGHPSLWLVHYTRGQAQAVPPIFQSTPSRKYPIPPAPTQPVFVLTHPSQQRQQQQMHAMQQQQAQLQHQQQQQQQQQHQQQQQQSRSPQKDQVQRMMQQRAAQARVEEDSDDEPEFLTKRDLAKARYMRNHEFMQDIFSYPPKLPDPAADPWSTFTPQSLQDKLAKLESELALAQQANAQRTTMLRSRRRDAEQEVEAEMDMEEEGVFGEGGEEEVRPAEAEGEGPSAAGRTSVEKVAGAERKGTATPDAEKEGQPAPAEGGKDALDTEADVEVEMDDAEAAAEVVDAAAAGEEEEKLDEEDMEADGEDDGDADGDDDPDEMGGPVEPEPDAEAEAEAEAEADGTPVPVADTTVAGGAEPTAATLSAAGEGSATDPVAGHAGAPGEDVGGQVPTRAEGDPHAVESGPDMDGAVTGAGAAVAAPVVVENGEQAGGVNGEGAEEGGEEDGDGDGDEDEDMDMEEGNDA